MDQLIFLRKSTFQFAPYIKCCLFLLAFFLNTNAVGKIEDIQPGYQLLESKLYPQANEFFTLWVSQHKYSCMEGTTLIDDCIEGFIAYSGLALSQLRVKELALGIENLDKSYRMLNIFEDIAWRNSGGILASVSGLENLTPEVTSSIENNWQAKIAEAHAALANLDPETLIKEKLESGELDGEQVAFYQYLLQTTNVNEVVKVKKPEAKLFDDAHYWSNYRDYTALISQLYCEPVNSFNSDAGAAQIATQLENNQANYFDEHLKRLTVKLGADESLDLSISDVLVPSVLHSLSNFIQLADSQRIYQGTYSKEMKSMLLACFEEIKPLVKVGIEKAKLNQMTNLALIEQLSNLIEEPLLSVSPEDVHLLKFIEGSLIYQQRDQVSGNKKMEAALNDLIVFDSLKGAGENSIINRVNALLIYAKLNCGHNTASGCQSSGKDYIIDKTKHIEANFPKVLLGTNHLNAFAGNSAEFSDSIIDSMPGGAYALSFGVYPKIKSEYTDQILHFKLAELYMVLGNKNRSKTLIFDNQFSDDAYSVTMLAYKNYLAAKWSESYGDTTDAREYWKKSVALYKETLPILENFFEIPKLYEATTSVFEGAAKFYHSIGEDQQALVVSELARSYSTLSPRRTHIDEKELNVLRQGIIAEYNRLLKKASIADQSLLKKYRYNPKQKKPLVPNVSDIFYLSDYVSILPKLTLEERYVFANQLSYYEESRAQFRFNKKLTGASKYYVSGLSIEILEGIQKSLPPDYFLVGIWQSVAASYLYTLDNKTIDFKVLNKQDRIDINDVYTRYIEPMIDGKRHLVFIVNGEYGQYPLAAMEGKNGQLIDQVSISYLPDLSYLNKLSPAKNISLKGAFFEPKLKGSVKIDSDKERAALLDFVSTNIYQSNRATRNNLAKAAADNSFVHISSHARLDLLDPRNSYFELNDGEGDSDYFYNHEVANYSFDGVDLFVLNACESAGFFDGGHQEFPSLPHSLMHSGSNAVISSVTRVSDDIANQFGEYFYTSLSKGISISESFYHAQKQLRQENPNSKQWAYYILNSNFSTLEKLYSKSDLVNLE